jgi:ferredoxin
MKPLAASAASLNLSGMGMPYSLRDGLRRGKDAAMKVVPDYDACEANAVCAGLVPEVFEVDDDDNLNILVDEVPDRLLEGVRHAVRSCPKAALRLTE